MINKGLIRKPQFGWSLLNWVLWAERDNDNNAICVWANKHYSLVMWVSFTVLCWNWIRLELKSKPQFRIQVEYAAVKTWCYLTTSPLKIKGGKNLVLPVTTFYVSLFATAPFLVAAHSTIWYKVTESWASNCWSSNPSHISVCRHITPYLLSAVCLDVMCKQKIAF